MNKLAIIISFIFAAVALGKTAKAPLIPAPLSWSMDVQGAVEALERAKMAPRQADRHGYFPGWESTGHTVEPEVFYTPRPGWTGEAHYTWSDADKAYRLDGIALIGALSQEALAKELAALERRYGPPTRRNGAQRVWVRGGVWLVVSPSATADAATGLWSLTESYRRDDRPAPP